MIIDNYIKSIGIDRAAVTRIYSERVPCSQKPHFCAVRVDQYPNAALSFSLSGTRAENFRDLSKFMQTR